MKLDEFIARFGDFSTWDVRKQIDYISYFLTAIGGKKSVFPKDIKEAFDSLFLREYTRVPQYFSENTSNPKGKYVKIDEGGYRLERHTFEEINSAVENEPTKIQVSAQLANLVPKIKNTNEKSFLIEAINCYRVGAYRATIVLVWIMVMDHLQNYIFGSKLNEFNVALGKNPDKKMIKIVNYDDFGELKESKFIELAKSSGIISNDIRKILDEKLGIRNSAAHPSGILFSSHKTTEFILDLISNIVLKY